MTTTNKTGTPGTNGTYQSGLRFSRRFFMAGAATAGFACGLGIAPALAGRGDVAFLGWEGYDGAFKADDLLAEAGASFQPTYIAAIEDIITKLRSGGIGSVDLTTLIHQYVGFSAQSGLLDPIDESLVPNIAQMHPRFQQLDELLRVDGKLYALPFTYSSIPLLYNPEKVEAPTSWRALLDPAMKGRVVGFPDVMSMIVTWSRVANEGIEDPTRMTREQLDKTVEIMVQLKENSRTVPSSLGEISDMFGRGEIDMAMGWEPMLTWVEGTGVTLKIASPVEGTFAYFDTVNIAKDAPNRDLDHALINHGLAAETQKAFAEQNILGIVNTEAMGMVENPLVSEIYGFDEIEGYFGDKFLPGMFPLEPEGDFVSWDEVLGAYETYQRA